LRQGRVLRPRWRLQLAVSAGRLVAAGWPPTDCRRM